MSENKCPSCGASIELNATECKYCGQAIATKQNTSAGQVVDYRQQQQQQQYNQSPQYNQSQQYQQPPMYNNPPTDKSKIVAGILAILLGGLGVHKFYLGRIGLGILYLLFCWTYIPAIIALVEGIIYLTSSEQKFYDKYVRK